MAGSKPTIAGSASFSLLAATISGLVVFVAMWLSVVNERPTRTEVAEMIQGSSPYIKDRQTLLDSAQDVKDLRRELAVMQKSQVRLETKLDQALNVK